MDAVLDRPDGPESVRVTSPEEQFYRSPGNRGRRDGREDRQGEEPKGTAPRRRPSRRLLVAIGFILAAMIGAGGWYYWRTMDIESTDDAQIAGNAVTIAPKVSGQVIAIAVKDNQRVRAGDLLVKIDPRDLAAAREKQEGMLKIAKATLEDAAASLDLQKKSLPAKLAQAKAQTAGAVANEKLAQANLDRQNSLTTLATTQQNKDQAVANQQAAQATVEADRAQEEVAALIPQNIAEAQAKYDQAKGQVAQAEAELKTAELNLSYVEVRAPQDGYVTHRSVQVGNYVQTDQALMGLVSPDIWVVANFKENQLNRMRPGQAATIRVDAYPGLALTGHVDSVQQGTGAVFSAMPAENATGNFVKIVQRVPVKIVIDGGLDPNLPLPLGLSVVPSVRLK